MQHIEDLSKINGGVMKDFVRRTLIAKDEPWWSKEMSEWKITAMHPWCPENSYTPDFWEDRVLRLLEFDVTHNHFGFDFFKLMELDVSTFIKVEEKIHEIVKRQNDVLPDDIKNAIANHRKKGNKTQ